MVILVLCSFIFAIRCSEHYYSRIQNINSVPSTCHHGLIDVHAVMRTNWAYLFWTCAIATSYCYPALAYTFWHVWLKSIYQLLLVRLRAFCGEKHLHVAQMSKTFLQELENKNEVFTII